LVGNVAVVRFRADDTIPSSQRGARAAARPLTRIKTIRPPIPFTGMSCECGPPFVRERALDPEPLLRSNIVDNRLVLSAGRSWTASHARELEVLVDGLGGQTTGAAALSLDMHAVDALDTFGAWLVERIVRDWQARGREAQITGLAERYRGLLQDVQRTNLKAR